MEPLEFMERLAALVPRPRLHLIRFHGVLAPNAKLRSKIVPAPASPATESPSEDAHGQGAPARISWACRPAARRVRRRVESIYSRRSEEPKAACQRKPTGPLALSSTEQLDKGDFARLPTALRPSRPVQHRVFH